MSSFSLILPIPSILTFVELGNGTYELCKCIYEYMCFYCNNVRSDTKINRPFMSIY